MLLCWVDIETAGLDEKSDPILEVAVVVTGYDLIEQTAMKLVVNPDISGRYRGWENRMEPEVHKMHTRSGLLRDVPFGVSAKSADDAFCDLLARVAEGEPFILAGSGVDRFDRRFLKSQLPKLAACLVETTSLDVGSVRRALRDLGGRVDLMPDVADSSMKRHRAMDDIQSHITEARIYAEYFDLIPREI